MQPVTPPCANFNINRDIPITVRDFCYSSIWWTSNRNYGEKTILNLKYLAVLALLGIGGISIVFSNYTSESEPSQSQPTSSNISALGSDDIVGQWRSVVENPAHPNTLARCYMRHTFFLDGEVVVENEENSSISSNWQYDNGIFIVKRSSGTSEFISHYRLNDRDNLEKILFQSTIDGEPLANYNPEDQFIRQGSSQDNSMAILDISASARGVILSPKSADRTPPISGSRLSATFSGSRWPSNS